MSFQKIKMDFERKTVESRTMFFYKDGDVDLDGVQAMPVNVDMKDAYGIAVFKTPSGRSITNAITVLDDYTIQFYAPSDELGVYEFEIHINNSNGRSISGRHSYEVLDSLWVEMSNTTVDLANQMSQMMTLFESQEAQRVVNENVRIPNENERIAAENARKAAFEQIEIRFEELINSSGDGIPEVVDARRDSKGTVHANLNTRINKEVQLLDTYNNVQDNTLTQLSNTKLDKTGTANKAKEADFATHSKTAEVLTEPVARPNLFVNGSFDRWGRHANSCTLDLDNAGSYFADRFYARGIGKYYFAREINQTVGPYVRIIPSTENTNGWINIQQALYIGQRVLQGKTVTLSYMIQCDKDMDFVVKAMEDHRTTSNTLYSVSRSAKAGQATKIVVTFENLTYPEAADTHTTFCLFGHGAYHNGMGAIRIWDAKLEIGGNATPYIPDDYITTLERCSASFQVMGTPVHAMAEQVSYYEGSVAVVDYSLPTRMYSLGVKKRIHSIGTADLKNRTGGIIAAKDKVDMNDHQNDGLYANLRFKNIPTGTTPQYANIIGLKLESEIYADTL